MRKKTYQQPMMKVVKVEQTGIICTSDQPPFKVKVKENEGYVEEVW